MALTDVAARPELPEQYLFDMCASAAMAEGDGIAVIGDPFFARECLRRLHGRDVTIVAPWVGMAHDCAPPTGKIRVVSDAGGVRVHRRLVMWSSPGGGDVSVSLLDAARLIAPGGALYAVFRGPLARLRAARSNEPASKGDLPGDRTGDWRACVGARATTSGEGVHSVTGTPTPLHGAAAPSPTWNRGALPGVHAGLGFHAIRRDLARRGLAIEKVYGFQSPRSLVWATAARIVDRAGRADLGDRCRFAMRATMVTRGATAWLCPVGLVVARKRTIAGR